MVQKVKFIRPHAVKLITLDSSASLSDVITTMITEEISLVPIINHGGKSNNGVYKRKRIFEWLIQNPGASLESIDKSKFINEKLPEVDMETPLEEAMELLKNKPAILIKEEGIYSALITPRVIANALDDYSKRFMVFESLEQSIRQLIVKKNIDLSSISPNGLNKTIPNDVKRLEFSQYSVVLSKKWDDIGLAYSKKIILNLLNSATDYRNALMHFRLDESTEGLKNAKKLIRLIGG